MSDSNSSEFAIHFGNHTILKHPLKSEDYYHLIRSNLDVENKRMGQLINWLVGAQGFLFIAYITLLNAPGKSRIPFMEDQLKLFLWIVPFSALSVSIFAYCGILSSNSHLIRLRNMWETYPKNRTVESFPPIQGNRLLRILSVTSVLLMPPVFIGCWMAALYFQIEFVRGNLH